MSPKLLTQEKETISFSILGLTLSSTNPGHKTVVIIISLLVFIIVMTFLLKTLLLPVITFSRGKHILQTLCDKIHLRKNNINNQI